MSSPIAKKDKSAFSQSLIDFHQKHSHSTRIEILAEHIAELVHKTKGADSELRCLDIGCGDMTLAERLADKIPSSTWKCLDLYEAPLELQGQERWDKYQQFDGVHLNFNEQEFDYALFCDVLHHDMQRAPQLLENALKVAKKVIIKEHFQYGLYSSCMLKLMDFIGNWGYGVSVPKNYFSKESFDSLVKAKGAQVVAISEDIELYRHNPLFNLLLNKAWQFVAVIQKVT